MKRKNPAYALATHECETCGKRYRIVDASVVMPLCGINNCFGNLKPLGPPTKTAPKGSAKRWK